MQKRNYASVCNFLFHLGGCSAVKLYLKGNSSCKLTNNISYLATVTALQRIILDFIIVEANITDVELACSRNYVTAKFWISSNRENNISQIVENFISSHAVITILEEVFFVEQECPADVYLDCLQFLSTSTSSLTVLPVPTSGTNYLIEISGSGVICFLAAILVFIVVSLLCCWKHKKG